MHRPWPRPSPRPVTASPSTPSDSVSQARRSMSAGRRAGARLSLTSISWRSSCERPSLGSPARPPYDAERKLRCVTVRVRSLDPRRRPSPRPMSRDAALQRQRSLRIQRFLGGKHGYLQLVHPARDPLVRQLSSFGARFRRRLHDGLTWDVKLLKREQEVTGVALDGRPIFALGSERQHLDGSRPVLRFKDRVEDEVVDVVATLHVEPALAI